MLFFVKVSWEVGFCVFIVYIVCVEEVELFVVFCFVKYFGFFFEVLDVCVG